MAKENYTPEEKKTLKKMFWNSRLVFSSFNMVKMEGNAFALTMEPALDELYKDKKEKAEAMRRHDGFFNTHAVLFSLIAGITYALERQKKETGAVDDTTIENIKVALMGPTAGIGDAFFFNCLRVIAAGIAIGLQFRIDAGSDQGGQHHGYHHGRCNGSFFCKGKTGMDDHHW